MTLYYQDDLVTLHHGDSLEILPTLDITVDVLLTDPPYFKVKQDEWDNQWDKAGEFLNWIGDFLDRAKPLLTHRSSVWVFASPAMTSSIERLVGERFRVLNSIRWVKQGSAVHRRSLPAMRSFVSAWEGIVFAEQKCDQLPSYATYIRSEREESGTSLKQVAEHFPSASGGFSGTAYNWERGLSMPSARDYEKLRELFGDDRLLRPYEEVSAEYEQERRPFHATDRKLSEDIWDFASVPARPERHPCEKPEPLLTHMIETSSRRGDLILDPFAGSGATLLAASRAGRRVVGIEKDERWCEHAAVRLSQGTLDIFGAA